MARMAVAGPVTQSPPAKDVIHVTHLAGKAGHKGAALNGHAGGVKAADFNALANGHHDNIRLDADLVQISVVGPGPAGLIRLANELGLDPQSLGHAVLVRLDADRSGQRHDLGPLSHGAGNLIGQGRHILDTAAIHAGNLFGPQADRAAGNIHGHVAAADDHHPLAGEIRHDIIANGASISTADMTFSLSSPGMPVFFILVGTDGNIQAVILLLQVLHPDILAHSDAGMYLDPQRQDGCDLGIQQVPGKR